MHQSPLDQEQVLAVYVAGARGRSAGALIRAIAQSENITLSGASDRSNIPGIGKDAGDLAHTTHLDVRVKDSFEPRRGCVVLDFSLPEAVGDNLALCRQLQLPVVLGPAAKEPATEQAIARAAQEIPIVYSSNYSEALTLLSHLAQQSAQVLGKGWDSEIFELHHGSKRKLPSRSAQRLGQDILRAKDQSPDHLIARTPGLGARQTDELGVASLRGGSSVGEHTVFFLGENERIELSHRAFDRSVFAKGTLRAARWVKSRAPGLYSMRDVLGLPALSP